MTDRIAWGPDSPGYPVCPVEPGTDCTVWFRSGRETRDDGPEGWARWDHGRIGGLPDYDIIAYQPHTEPDQSDLLAAISTLRDTLQTALKLVDAIHDAERNR